MSLIARRWHYETAMIREQALSWEISSHRSPYHAAMLRAILSSDTNRWSSYFVVGFVVVGPPLLAFPVEARDERIQKSILLALFIHLEVGIGEHLCEPFILQEVRRCLLNNKQQAILLSTEQLTPKKLSDCSGENEHFCRSVPSSSS